MTEDPFAVNAYKFLLEKYEKRESFSKIELQNSVNYPNSGRFDTKFSKKLKHLVESLPDNPEILIVSEIFRLFSDISKFKVFFSQTTKLKAEYLSTIHPYQMNFDFYMPLTNEGILRSVLDELFYLDTLKFKLKKIKKEELEKAFPLNEGETLDDYHERILNWISNKFGGYSIGQVIGRYKVEDTQTFEEFTEFLKQSRRYLIDETTSIVKFIFPLGNPLKSDISFDYEYFDLNLSTPIPREIILESNKIRFLFSNLLGFFRQNLSQILSQRNEILYANYKYAAYNVVASQW